MKVSAYRCDACNKLTQLQWELNWLHIEGKFNRGLGIEGRTEYLVTDREYDFCGYPCLISYLKRTREPASLRTDTNLDVTFLVGARQEPLKKDAQEPTGFEHLVEDD